MVPTSRSHPQVGRKDEEEDDEEERPTAGELLSPLPAWPREWVQRLGREAEDLGARSQVQRSRGSADWELCWLLDRRPFMTFRLTPQGVRVLLAVPERAVVLWLQGPSDDEEFRRDLLRASLRRGLRKVEVGLGSAVRARAVSDLLRIVARVGP